MIGATVGIVSRFLLIASQKRRTGDEVVLYQFMKKYKSKYTEPRPLDMIGSGPWVHEMSREAKAPSAQDENEGAEKAPTSRPDIADAILTSRNSRGKRSSSRKKIVDPSCCRCCNLPWVGRDESRP